ncbi:MAG: efflux transporter periplasmic adaptor subunit, partial [Anaerovorax sp.]
MKRKKKIIIIVIVIGVVAVGAMAVLKITGGSGETGMPVSTATAEIRDVEEVVSIKGVISGSDVADVSSSTTYEVNSILVKEGDRVN